VQTFKFYSSEHYRNIEFCPSETVLNLTGKHKYFDHQLSHVENFCTILLREIYITSTIAKELLPHPHRCWSQYHFSYLILHYLSSTDKISDRIVISLAREAPLFWEIFSPSLQSLHKGSARPLLFMTELRDPLPLSFNNFVDFANQLYLVQREIVRN